MEVKWQAALYFDDRANEDQMNALGAIFSGQSGGHPARLATHIGTVLGAGPATIRFEKEGKRTSMTITGVAEAVIVGADGQGDGAITVEGHPLAIAPGYAASVAHSEKMTYTDHGMQWNLEKKNGLYSPFEYAA